MTYQITVFTCHNAEYKTTTVNCKNTGKQANLAEEEKKADKMEKINIYSESQPHSVKLKQVFIAILSGDIFLYC